MRAVIEGTPKELREFFRGMSGAIEVGGGIDAETVAAELAAVTPNARAAVEYISSNAAKAAAGTTQVMVAFDAVAKHVGVTTKVLSGNMSSLANSAPGVTQLIDRDYDKRVYIIDVDDARTILEGIKKIP